MNEQTDHDILIEIRTKVNFFHEWSIKHAEEDASRFSIIENKLTAVHRRLDWIMPTAVISILLFIVGIGGFIISSISKIH